jgi:hypothetical protein
LVVDVGGTDVFIEAESRSPLLPYLRSRLENTLRHARKQLPKSGPGVVVVDVPQSWFKDPRLNRELGAIAEDFLRQTKRVNLVQLIGKRYTILGPRRMKVEHWKWGHPNRAPRTPVDGLDQLIRHIVVAPDPDPSSDSQVLASFWDDAAERGPSRPAGCQGG